MSERIVIRKHERVNYSKNNFYTLLHTFHQKDKYIDYHWHNSIEITYVVKGSKIQHMEDKKIIAPVGTLLLVNSGVIHDIVVKKGLEGIVLLIDRDYIDYICPQCKNRGFCLDKDYNANKEIVDYLFKLVETYENNNLLEANIIVLKIIKVLADKLTINEFYVKEKHDDESYELVISVMKFINQYYYQKITLDKLAFLTNYNKAYLSNVFKKKTGITISEYLRNVRLEHCLDDLKYKKDTIAEIALNNGFANIQIFNRVFKDIYNITPNQYRKKTCKNK